MAWGTPLWSLGGVGIYVNSDTGWIGSSGDAEMHILESDETTVHHMGKDSLRRTWRGLVRTKASRDALVALVATNVAYVTPYAGDSGTCRVLNVSGRSVTDTREPLVTKYQMTAELMQR